MTTWLDVVDDSRAIHAIYGGEAPPLGWVDLHEVSVHRDGPQANLRFDLSTYPTNPPKKWQDSHFNTAQVELALFPLYELLVEGFHHDSRVNLCLTSRDETVEAVTRAGSTKMRIVAQHVVIVKIAGYSQEREI
ncbi:MAG TPA: Imm50 family immunity protein [Mycobacteriales bacterium]|jgi:hypothetical protein